MLELTACDTVDELVDMANVGCSLMDAIESIQRCPGPFQNWSPADDPAEIVGDLFNALEEEWAKNANADAPPADPAPADRLIIIDDMALEAAIDAHDAVLMHAGDMAQIMTGMVSANDDLAADSHYAAMAACIRDIGTRATPEVLGHQLKILGLRKSPELSRPEAIAIKAFASVLMDLDAYVAEEKAKAQAAARAQADKPKPLPIEDTTMEPTDGPMDTWG